MTASLAIPDIAQRWPISGHHKRLLTRSHWCGSPRIQEVDAQRNLSWVDSQGGRTVNGRPLQNGPCNAVHRQLRPCEV